MLRFANRFQISKWFKLSVLTGYSETVRNLISKKSKIAPIWKKKLLKLNNTSWYLFACQHLHTISIQGNQYISTEAHWLQTYDHNTYILHYRCRPLNSVALLQKTLLKSIWTACTVHDARRSVTKWWMLLTCLTFHLLSYCLFEMWTCKTL